MKIEQIPGESSRYLVQSESRDDIKHLVDLEYQEGREKPHPACSCEQYMAKGKVCKHIEAVQQLMQSNQSEGKGGK